MTENECAKPSVNKSGWKGCLQTGLWIGLTLAGLALIAWLGGHTNQHEWAVGWLSRYERFSPWPFCLLITLEGFAVSVALSSAYSLIHKAVKAPEEKERFEGMSSVMVALRALLIAPVAETLLLQALVIWSINEWEPAMGTQVAASAYLFALAHFEESISVGIVAGIPCGLYLGFTFAFWLQDSFWTAFWVTAVSHFLHNLVSIAIYLMGRICQKMTKKRRSEQEEPPVDRE